MRSRGPDASTAPLLGGLDIVVVDDEPDARWLLACLLRRAGARVRTASSVREAEQLLAERRPDLLVSDVGMPGEDGRTFLARLREQELEQDLPRLPAVAVSAFANPREHAASRSAGFDLQLDKPVTPNALVQILAGLVRDA